MTCASAGLSRRALNAVLSSGGWMNATDVWTALGGRSGLLGLLRGPSFAGVLAALGSLASHGLLEERLLERPDSRPRRYWIDPALAGPADLG